MSHVTAPDAPVPLVGDRREPQVLTLTVDDISDALTAGLRDFRTAPAYGLVFGGVSAAAGWLMVQLMLDYHLIYLAYPLIAGFALIGPLAAVGLYETSRRLERGEPVSWRLILGAIWQHGGRELGFMGLVAMFGLVAWIFSAGFLYALFFGGQAADLDTIITLMVTTPRGLAFLVVGNLVGAVMALTLFSLSVVSYPMLIDRDVDFVTAMTTSIRVVVANPAAMIGWGIFIGTMLFVAILPMFLGLVLVLPLLGHATWHLYRRAVAQDATAA